MMTHNMHLRKELLEGKTVVNPASESFLERYEQKVDRFERVRNASASLSGDEDPERKSMFKFKPELCDNSRKILAKAKAREEK